MIFYKNINEITKMKILKQYLTDKNKLIAFN